MTWSYVDAIPIDANAGSAYLIGLSCLLQSMPKQTSMTELPKVAEEAITAQAAHRLTYTLIQLLPLLLKALHLPELDLRANVVDTLALLVKDAPETIKGQADAIVNDLLRNALYNDAVHDTDAAAVSSIFSRNPPGVCSTYMLRMVCRIYVSQP